MEQAIKYQACHEDDIMFAIFIAAGDRHGKKARRRAQFLQFLVTMVLIAATFYYLKDGMIGYWYVLVPVVFLVLLLMFMSPTYRIGALKKAMRQYMMSYPFKEHCMKREVKASEEGLKIRNSYGHAFYEWCAFDQSAIWRDYFFMYNGLFGYVSIPLSAFEKEEQKQEFIEFCRTQIKNAPCNTPLAEENNE